MRKCLELGWKRGLSLQSQLEFSCIAKIQSPLLFSLLTVTLLSLSLSLSLSHTHTHTHHIPPFEVLELTTEPETTAPLLRGCGHKAGSFLPYRLQQRAVAIQQRMTQMD